MSTGSNVATAEKIQKVGVRTLVQIGMLAAIAVVLMLFEIPLPFAPSFYKIDFSEVPVMVGCFVMGPLAGAAIEFVKILLNFVINGTTTAGVGELANFLVGCALCVPAGIIYKYKRTRKGALLGMIAGTLLMVVVGSAMNAFVGEFANFVMGCAFVVPASVIYKRKKNRQHAMIGLVAGTVIMSAAAVFINALVLLPAYAKAFGMPIDALVAMGTAVNSHITSLSTFVLFAVAPFNLLKGILVSLIVLLIYKKISPIFKMR